MTTLDENTLRTALPWGSIGFGALATLAPRAFGALYGTADQADLRLLSRLWGTRTAVLGVLALGAEGAEAKKLAQLAAAMNIADALMIAGAGPEVASRTKVLGSLSSAAFAVGFGIVATS